MVPALPVAINFKINIGRGKDPPNFALDNETFVGEYNMNDHENLFDDYDDEDFDDEEDMDEDEPVNRYGEGEESEELEEAPYVEEEEDETLFEPLDEETEDENGV